MDKHTRNTNKKIFKVNFTTKAYCNGIYSFMNGHLTVPAESKEEAILKVANCNFEYFRTNSIQEINLSEL